MRNFTAAAAALATAIVLTGAPAIAQAPPPGAEEACGGDAMRLCQDLISEGNHGKIKACLIRNRRSLSPECAAFFGRGRGHRHRRPRSY
jgi:hypothetical protein